MGGAAASETLIGGYSCTIGGAALPKISLGNTGTNCKNTLCSKKHSAAVHHYYDLCKQTCILVQLLTLHLFEALRLHTCIESGYCTCLCLLSLRLPRRFGCANIRQ